MSSEIPRTRWRKRRITLLALGITALLLLAACFWLIGTTSGARTAIAMLVRSSGNQVQIGEVEGRLAGPLRLASLSLQHDGMLVTMKDVRLQWQARALLHQRLHIESLLIGELAITSQIKQEKKAARLPDSIGLPVALKIDRVQISGGNINWGPVNVIRLGGFSFNLDYDGARYQLGLQQFAAGTSAGAHVFDGALRGEMTLSTSHPYPIAAHFTTEAEALLQQQRLKGGGTINLQGSLAEMIASIDMAIGDTALRGQSRLRPFTAAPLGDTALQLQALDLAMFGAGLPHTRFNGKLTANGVNGELTLSNTGSGPYNAGRLPLRSLSLRFTQHARQITLDSIAASLGSEAKPAGAIRGTGSLNDGALQLALATDGLDLQRLDQRLLATRLAGQADLQHAAGKQIVTLQLSEPLEKKRLAVSARAILADAAIAIEFAELRLGKGHAQAQGQLQLAGTQNFRLAGTFNQFNLQDLGQFSELPSLYLTGEFLLQGKRAPQLAADISFKVKDSRLAGHPLQGDGMVHLRNNSLDIPRLQMESGNNRLAVSGRLAQDGGQLQFDLAAAQLASLGPEFAGSLQVKGVARGSYNRPHISARWSANQLRAPGRARIDHMQGSAEIDLDRQSPLLLSAATLEIAATGMQTGMQQLAALDTRLRFAPQANAPLSLQVRARQYTAPNFQADQLNIDASGTTGRHTMEALIHLPSQQWQLQASGALENLARAPRWQGSINQLNGNGQFQTRLAAPAPLSISAQRLELQQFRLDAQHALIDIQRFVRDASGMTTRGRFERLQLAALLPLLQPVPDIKTDLLLGGQWDIALTGKLRGTLAVTREQGDVSTLGTAPVALGLRQLEASASAANGQLSVQFLADGKQLGNISLQAGIPMNGGCALCIAPQAPLTGHARMRIPSLRWAGPLIAPAVAIDGSLQSEVAFAGSFSQPRLSGHITGNALRLALPEQGIDVRNGTLNSSFQDTRLVIHHLTFMQPGGQLTMTGPIDLTNAKPSAQLAIRAERFTLLDRADRRLVLSGDSQVNLLEGRLGVNGRLTVNQGMFDIGRTDKPALSSDVVIVGDRHAPSGTPLALALDMTIGLGDGVAIRGRGIDALLAGQLLLKSDAGEPIEAQGTLRVAKGTYSAYGRKLAIETGLLRFNGALTNPSLDILAMRRGQQIEVGVSVRGSVLAPRVTLVSDPVVPDAEKLSWLVLGRGLETATGGTDLAALQSAAGALLTEGAAAGVQARLASAVGLDELSVASSKDSLEGSIVTLGKQISSRLYVSIKRGLESASSVLQLRYTISPRLTLEVDTGTRTAMTIFYNFAFD